MLNRRTNSVFYRSSLRASFYLYALQQHCIYGFCLSSGTSLILCLREKFRRYIRVNAESGTLSNVIHNLVPNSLFYCECDSSIFQIQWLSVIRREPAWNQRRFKRESVSLRALGTLILNVKSSQCTLLARPTKSFWIISASTYRLYRSVYKAKVIGSADMTISRCLFVGLQG